MDNKKPLISIGYCFNFFISSLITSSCLAAQNESIREPLPKRIELHCGQHTVAIICGKIFDPEHPEKQCNHNTLSFTGPNGKTKIIDPPKGLDSRKTPMGMSCVKGNNAKYYVEVYLAPDINAGVQWTTFHLFESSGKRLTADLTDRMSQFGRLGKVLQIPYDTKMIYIEGEMK